MSNTTNLLKNSFVVTYSNQKNNPISVVVLSLASAFVLFEQKRISGYDVSIIERLHDTKTQEYPHSIALNLTKI